MQKNMQIFTLYRQVAEHSRGLAKVKVRNSFFAVEMGKRLGPYGGMKVWLSLHVVTMVGIVFFSLLPFYWAEIGAIICAFMLSYIVGLHNFTALICDLLFFFQRIDTRDSVYTRVTSKMINRFSIVIVPLFFIVILLIVSYRNILFAHRIIGWIALIALIAFIINQLAHLLKNFSDYISVIKVATGSQTAIVRTNEQLTLDISRYLQDCYLTKEQLKSLHQLADADLRQEEIRLELTNLSLAVVAIFVSILFSEYLINSGPYIINAISIALRSVSEAASNLLVLSPRMEQLFATTMYIGLWWQFINLLLGLIFIFSNSLLKPYYVYYRSAYSLLQALILLNLEDKVEISTHTPKTKGFWASLFNRK